MAIVRSLSWSLVALAMGCSFEGGPGSVLPDGDRVEPDAGSDGSVAGTGYRKAITVVSDQVVGMHLAFPAWFEVTDPDLAQRATTDGRDLHFRLPDGTALPYEIVRWDPSTGHLQAWVRLDLGGTAPTVFDLRYGDRSAAHEPVPAAVFADNFAAVWHFDDDLAATTVRDSTLQRAGTALNGVAATPGQLGGGFLFDGVDDEVSFADMFEGPAASSSHTISA
jgi:hypothetical protein